MLLKGFRGAFRYLEDCAVVFFVLLGLFVPEALAVVKYGSRLGCAAALFTLRFASGTATGTVSRALSTPCP